MHIGKAPDTVRDQAMRHDPKWAIFNHAYINEKIQFDVQNAILNEPLEDELIQFWSHMGMARDPRATRNMVPAEVWKNMPPDAEIMRLESELAKLKGNEFRIEGRDNEKEIRAAVRKLRTKKSQRTKNIQDEFRRFYFHNSSNWEVERQLRGVVEGDEKEEEEYMRPAINLQIPERAELAVVLIDQPDNLSSEELNKRRIQAAELMTALNQKREAPNRRRIQKTEHAGLVTTEKLPEPTSFPLVMKETQCPECIGDKMLSYLQRCFEFCRRPVLQDHFDNIHLEAKEKAEEAKERILCMHLRCQDAGIEIWSVNEYRNHVKTVHKVSLRTAERVTRRRAKPERVTSGRVKKAY